MSLERRGLMRVGIIGALAVAFAGVGKFFNPAPLDKIKIIKTASLEVGATTNFVLAKGPAQIPLPSIKVAIDGEWVILA